MALSQILVIGDLEQTEFAAAGQWLSRRADCRVFANAASALAAITLQGGGRNPDAILFVQSRPGQISQLDVERLFAASPLARLVGLIGPWCEGELRSGQPWKGVARISWRSWARRLPGELGLTIDGEPTSPPLPRTANEIERLEKPIVALLGAGKKTADVLTAKRETFEAVSDVLNVLGVRARWQLPKSPVPSEPADDLVIDGWANVTGELASSAARRVLLLHFPRPDDLVRASKLGLTVLAQPHLLADWAAALAAT